MRIVSTGNGIDIPYESTRLEINGGVIIATPEKGETLVISCGKAPRTEMIRIIEAYTRGEKVYYANMV